MDDTGCGGLGWASVRECHPSRTASYARDVGSSSVWKAYSIATGYVADVAALSVSAALLGNVSACTGPPAHSRQPKTIARILAISPLCGGRARGADMRHTPSLIATRRSVQRLS